MVRSYVLPTQEDQMEFAAGRRPENHFVRDFPERTEADAYVDGLGAVNDLREYSVVGEGPGLLRIDFEGEVVEVRFATAGEKEAYRQGLEDGDGFVSPAVHREGSPEFDAIEELLASPAPSL